MAALFDTNIWIFLLFDHHPFHQSAVTALNSFSSRNSVFFNRETQKSFLRLATTEAITKGFGCKPLTNAEAWHYYHVFLKDGRISFMEEPESLGATWESISAKGTSSPKLWMDSYLAAFAMTTGLLFVTADGGFSQFSGLNYKLVR